jgi:hypothetical protein
MVMKRAEDYASFSQDLAWRLLAEVSLDEETFGHVAELCFGPGEVEANAAAVPTSKGCAELHALDCGGAVLEARA